MCLQAFLIQSVMKYVPLRQRAGTQKVQRRKLLVQHVIYKNACENARRTERVSEDADVTRVKKSRFGGFLDP
jgi:hypothetical protein